MDESARAELEKVYRDTNYVVRRDGREFVIRIGEHSAAVDQLLIGSGAESWAFLTAWNPYSGQLPDEENDRRQNELLEALNTRKLSYLPGAGEFPTGNWPPEESVLVFGISRNDAVALASEFEQNAIVFGRTGEPPELIWCS